MHFKHLSDLAGSAFGNRARRGRSPLQLKEGANPRVRRFILGALITGLIFAALVAQLPANAATILSDSFDDGTRDTSKWNFGVLSRNSSFVDQQVQVGEQSGGLTITPRASMTGYHYNGYVSVPTWNLTGALAAVQLVQKASGSTNTIFSVGIDSANWYGFRVTGTTLYLESRTAGTTTTVSITYSATQHRFWRVRHNSGNDSIVFETSADGATWVARRTVARQIAITKVKAEMVAGSSLAVSAPGKALFDNFHFDSNTATPTPTPVPSPTPTPAPNPSPTPTPAPSPTPTPTQGAQYYVAPNGSSSGDGSIGRPWNLATALSQPSTVKAGATIWLRGGTYGTGGKTLFTSKLTGTSSAPIKVRQYSGERAIVNGGIKANGAYTWFWGFEITNTSTNRDRVSSDVNVDRPAGLFLYGQGDKAINLVIDNTGRGGVLGLGPYATTNPGASHEIYGTIFWGNGIYDTSTQSGTRGDGVYLNSGEPNPSLALIEDCISFRNFLMGFKVFSQWSNVHINNFTLNGNVAFDHQFDWNLIASNEDHAIKGLRVTNNYTYQPRNESHNSVKIGHASIQNNDAVIRDNYFVSGTIGFGAMYVNGFSTLQATGNTVVSPNVLAQWNPGATSTSLQWDRNTFYGGSSSPFKYKGSSSNFAGWKSATHFDANSSDTAAFPTGTKVFVRPNKYEQGRANVIVYNWENDPMVNVDLSGVLKSGASYEIRDAQNYFGKPVVSGVYNGGLISLPMYLSAVSPIVGNRHVQNLHTDPEFGVFVVLTK
jgi:hypothetical protein